MHKRHIIKSQKKTSDTKQHIIAQNKTNQIQSKQTQTHTHNTHNKHQQNKKKHQNTHNIYNKPNQQQTNTQICIRNID